MQSYTTTLLEKKTIADRIIQLRFFKPKNFDFLAGQFIQVEVPQTDKNVFRSYSLSSAPHEGYIELCVKLYETGLASQLFSKLNNGDPISFKGPAGRFTMSQAQPETFHIATGVGLAPIMGILRDELENKKNPDNVHLIFGVRHETDIFWTQELDELEQKYFNFSYSLTLSQPQDEWKGLRGRVTEHIPENMSNTQAFLCGSADMVKTVREMLIARGTDAKNIHFEIF
jgi:ferredoxin-NADP reductase